MARYSYTSASIGVLNRAVELTELIKKARRPAGGAVEFTLGVFRATAARVLEHTGVRLEGLRGLDIGPGQYLGCLRCFSLTNQMTAIDTDVIAQGFHPSDFARMLWHNSWLRTFKTMARRTLGADARFEAELARALGVPGFARQDIQRMSATAMTFPSNSFDFVYSHSVFEHIDDPRAALAEAARVLKPGGVAYISVHHYTSHSGQHDPKILAGPSVYPPFWPHLRPTLQHTVHPNAYLNKLRHHEWKAMFAEVMPGSVTVNDRQDDEIGDGLKELRGAGELADYTDEELMTVNIAGIWKKPA